MKTPFALIATACALSLPCHAADPAGLSSGSRASGLDALKAGFGAASTTSGGNMIPNWNFSDPAPLKFYRFDFPYQEWYVDNVKYMKQVSQEGRNCAQLDLPPGIAGNQGAKIETALVPCEPGATYRAEVEAMTWDFSAKIHAEAYACDPRPEAVRSDAEAKGAKLTIARIPAMNGRPTLVQIYRAQFPDPPPHSHKWDKVERDFHIPMEWKVAGETVKPAFLTIKCTVYDATMGGGKSYFTGFKLTKIKEPDAKGAPTTTGPASDKTAVVR